MHHAWEEEEELFRRFTETHFQRGYTPKQIERLLERAGMELVTMFDADTNENVNEQSERILVVARESGKRTEEVKSSERNKK